MMATINFFFMKISDNKLLLSNMVKNLKLKTKLTTLSESEIMQLLKMTCQEHEGWGKIYDSEYGKIFEINTNYKKL